MFSRIGIVVALLALLALAGRAGADDGSAGADARAAAELKAAEARAGSGDPAALDALEALGGERPVTRWTDNAWADAARIAENRGEFARARADLQHVLATTDDDSLRRRAQAALARLAQTTGAHGEWDAVVARHDALAETILGGIGDPKPAIAELDALVRDHPTYPGATAARLVIARGWERDGELATAIAVLDDAVARAPTPELRARARYAAFHARVRARDIDGARDDLTAIAATPGVEAGVVAQLEDALATAQLRARLRIAVWIALALAAVIAIVRARRDAGSWRAIARAALPPPSEVWYVAPLMVVLAAVASMGNPMVARAVRALAMSGVAIAWLSGVSLELAPGGLRGRRIVIHVAIVAVVVACIAFLISDRDRMLDLLVETWRSGPALP